MLSNHSHCIVAFHMAWHETSLTTIVVISHSINLGIMKYPLLNFIKIPSLQQFSTSYICTDEWISQVALISALQGCDCFSLHQKAVHTM
jgi:hypothetical protein